jgi:tRNA nucleotidyltransferase (CCA-adding enzyme)
VKRVESPGAVRWIARTLEAAGFETWAVGGAVRDALAGTTGGDWDLATRAKPVEVRKLFRRTVPIRMDHGTVGVLARDGTMYEVTTFRRDVETTGRHAVVAFAETLDEDLARRDFTINALAWHPLREELHDPFGGRTDLARGVLRTVGRPEERFAEDYLRVLRALRFAGAFGLRIEAETWRALTRAVPSTGLLSAERVREELEKVMGGTGLPSRALALYAASGALAYLYPELDALVGHPMDGHGGWFAWSLAVVDVLPARRPDLRLAALLAGIGEPERSTGAGEAGRPPGERAFLRAAAVLTRLRASNARIAELAELSRWIARPPAPDASDASLRRWLARVERGRLRPLFRVWCAELRVDRERRGRWTDEAFGVLWRRVRAIARSGAPLSLPEVVFTGRDLIRMGYAPGPHFGDVLDHLLDRVLENPEMNRTALLEEEADAWLRARGKSPRRPR